MADPLASLREMRDRMGIRLPAMLMVVGCTALSAAMFRVRHRDFAAGAITEAPAVLLSTSQGARVEQVLVSVGERVQQGQTIAVLSSHELLAERDEIDAEIRRVVRSAELARLELAHGLEQEQRDALFKLIDARRDAEVTLVEREQRAQEAGAVEALHQEAERLVGAGLIDSFHAREAATEYQRVASQKAQSAANTDVQGRRLGALRRELDRVGAQRGLSEATAQLYAAELDVLDARRSALKLQLDGLRITAPSEGIIAEISTRGSSLLPGAIVARVVAVAAHDVVAFVPPNTTVPNVNAPMDFSVTLADGRSCRGRSPLRSTREAVLKPAQLVGFGGADAWGFPVRFALPPACALPIGMVVELAFEMP